MGDEEKQRIEKLRKGVEKLFEDVKPEDYDNFLARRTPIQLKVFRDNVNIVLADMERSAGNVNSAPYNVQEKIGRLRYLSTRASGLIKVHEERALSKYMAQTKTEKPNPPRQIAGDHKVGYRSEAPPSGIKKKTENISAVPIISKENDISGKRAPDERETKISDVAGLIGIPAGCWVGGNYSIESLYGFSRDAVEKFFSDVSSQEAVKQMDAIAEAATYVPYTVLGAVAGYFVFKYGSSFAYRAFSGGSLRRERRRNIIST